MDNTPNSNSGLLNAVRKIVIGYWPLLLTGILFVILQWPVFKNWWDVWEDKEGYYSHGVLVPFIVAFMLWTQRNKLAKADVRHSWFGLVLLLVCIPTYLIGLMMGLRVLYGVAFFLFIFGTMLMILGWRVTRICLIPILFLLTMIPIANWILDALTAHFQLISASVAAKFLQLTSGQDITQYGNTIYSPGLPGAQTLLVGSPCSGLRLLISLITFNCFFVYVIRGAWWKKAVMLIMSLPLSVFINSLRITMIGYVGFWTGSSEAMHKFHDYSGYIGLVICFFILFGIAKLLKMGDIYTGEAVEAVGTKPWSKPVGAGVHGTIVIALFVVIGILSNMIKPLYDLPKGHIDRGSIPESFDSWTSEKLQIDSGTRQILGMGDLMSRLYTDPNSGRQVQVFVDAALDTAAFHDPHLCLPGGGSPISKDQSIAIHFSKPRPTTVKATMLQASGDYGSSLLIYWYTISDRSLPRTDSVITNNRLSKMQDLKRLVAQPWNTRELRQDILKRQYTWYRFSTEAYGDGNDEAFLKQFIRDFIAKVNNYGE